MFYENIAGHRLYYQTFGESGMPAIFFVNGIFQEAESWKKVISFFPNHFVVIFDLLNQGQSDETEKYLSMDEQASSIIQLAKFLKLSKFSIVGISYGGMVCQRLMVLYPEKILKAVLISTMARKTIPFQNFCKSVTKLSDYGSNPHALEMGMTFNPMGEIFGLNHLSKNHNYWSLQKATNLIKSIETCEIDYRSKLSGCVIPTLVVQGEMDVIAPVMIGKELAASIPNALFKSITRKGHVLNMEAPSELAELIGTHLK